MKTNAYDKNTYQNKKKIERNSNKHLKEKKKL